MEKYGDFADAVRRFLERQMKSYIVGVTRKGWEANSHATSSLSLLQCWDTNPFSRAHALICLRD